MGMGTQPTRAEFAGRTLSYEKEAGPALEGLRGIEDDTSRLFNTMAFLVAGHDTTAHTLEWALLELARRPDVQARCRSEANTIFAKLQEEGRSLTYEDLDQFVVTNAVIMEVLRLWGPAWFVFHRILPEDADIKGRHGMVTLTKGTPVNFWLYGHHHAKRLWGDDAGEFEPLKRTFSASELQTVTKSTPYSRRFHPFSLPPRDCLGKNFSLLEMRVFIPHLLHRFQLRMVEESAEYMHVRSQGAIFQSWLSRTGTIKPPDGLKLEVSPVSQTSRL